jgi:catechol 2,3-dioxygenase-like lactoylglutathione lyase family enzyme
MPIGTNNPAVLGAGMHHVTVQARDWEASLRLYRDILGMAPVAEWDMSGQKFILLDMGDGSHIELTSPTDDTPRPGAAASNDPLTHLAIATTDARSAIEHVRQAGYAVTMEPRDVNLGGILATVAFFEGPSGERIEFLETR